MVSWESEVDGLLRVLATSRNESLMRARYHVNELRAALRRMERRLDESTGPDSRTSEDQQSAGLVMKEPLYQQQQPQQQQQQVSLSDWI